MVDFKLTNAYSPTLFTTDSYQVVVIPLARNESTESRKRDREARQAEATQPTEPVAEQAKPVAEVVAEAERENQ